MKDLYWNPVEQPERVKAVYSTLYGKGRIVLELRKDGCLWSSSAGMYAGLNGDLENTLVQLQNSKEGLIVCSLYDGTIQRSNAHHYLIGRGISPDELATAGVQKIRADLKDAARRTMMEFVAQYFSDKPQDRRA